MSVQQKLPSATARCIVRLSLRFTFLHYWGLLLRILFLSQDMFRETMINLFVPLILCLFGPEWVSGHLEYRNNGILTLASGMIVLYLILSHCLDVLAVPLTKEENLTSPHYHSQASSILAWGSLPINPFVTICVGHPFKPGVEYER